MTYIRKKVTDGQAEHIIINLKHTDVTTDEIKAILLRKPITDLEEKHDSKK